MAGNGQRPTMKGGTIIKPLYKILLIHYLKYYRILISFLFSKFENKNSSRENILSSLEIKFSRLENNYLTGFLYLYTLYSIMFLLWVQ